MLEPMIFVPRPRLSLAPLLSLLFAAALCVLFWGPAAVPVGAEEDTAKERGRKNAVKGLRSKIRKLARSPYAHKPAKKAQFLKDLEALSALGGVEAGRAALEALPHTDKDVRDAAFEIVEREHDKSLVTPIVDLLVSKEFRRDADAKRRLVHALSVISDPGSILPLSDLIRFDEDAEVVAEAADALAGFTTAKLELRKIAVRRLVDLYGSTWNLKESVKTDKRDKILRRQATEKYKVYGKSLRFALQALTGVQLSRPREWRDWWNENKKKKKWTRSS